MHLKRHSPARVSALVTLAVLLATSSAIAQTTTATVRGTVVDDTGALPGAAIVAKETGSGFTHEATSGADGGFTLPGLRPGTYEISVSMPQYKPAARRLTVLVGQDIDLDFRLTADLVYAENVTVVGDTAVETRTSEIATYVTSKQLRDLPQNDRNFLNFAALAPGVRVNAGSETTKEVTAGALPGFNTNVYIDGVSFKNDVLLGGVVGQDSSRGNPFPQNAVQEYRVLTQNFSAEYEKASSAAITAVTKSGTNVWTGDVFLLYQDKNLVAQDVFAEERGEEKPTYQRFQGGASIGGPIIHDKMTFFGSYEQNRQDRDKSVFYGGSPTLPAVDLSHYLGTFESPFRSHLGFAKLSYQPGPGQTLDLSYSLRHESELKDFGDQRSLESAIDFTTDVNTGTLRHVFSRQGWINEASLTFQRFEWNTQPQNADLIGQDYQGVLRIGGADTEQLFVQDRLALRDDYSRFFDWRGKHAAKAGFVVSRMKYDVTKFFTANPVYRYRSSENFEYPFEAQWGLGDPNLNAKNTQLGLYLQDDWSPTKKLTLNLGLRWDWESNELNNDYVTPANVVAAVSSFVPSSYITDGDDRPTFKGAWQPRVGFSYDLRGNGRTVVFGAFGRYYDRVLYNSGLDERFRQQFAVGTFRFSLDGQPRDGQPTVVWDPAYLTRAGLARILATGQTGRPEVFLIENDTEPPVSDQYSVGLRHTFGSVVTSVAYAGGRSRNGFTFIFGNRNPNGECCFAIPGFSNVLLSTDAKKAWYDAMFVTIEKPYTAESKWSAQATYTLGRAEEIGGDLFSLDYIDVPDYPRHPTATDERHRIVAAGTYEFPAGFRASTFIQLASGVGYTIEDFSQGFGINEKKIQLYTGRPDATFAYKSVDLRLDKVFRIGERQAVELTAQVFNVFNWDNYTGYNQFIPPLPETNSDFGQPTREDPKRRLQFGASYRV
jgi:outer membrane receptor protein involved in Fe transport